MYLGRENDFRKNLSRMQKRKLAWETQEKEAVWYTACDSWDDLRELLQNIYTEQFLCLGFDFLCPKIVGELWVRKGLHQRAVFMLAWGLDWLACFRQHQ